MSKMAQLAADCGIDTSPDAVLRAALRILAEMPEIDLRDYLADFGAELRNGDAMDARRSALTLLLLRGPFEFIAYTCD